MLHKHVRCKKTCQAIRIDLRETILEGKSTVQNCQEYANFGVIFNNTVSYNSGIWLKINSPLFGADGR